MRKFKIRHGFISIGFLIIIVVYIIKLFYIQVINKQYKFSANNNVLRYEIQQPQRGLIYDRDSIIIVSNKPSYDLMIIPREIEIVDTLAFANLLNIQKEEVIIKINEAKNYSNYRESVFLKQIDHVSAANLQEKLYQYPGFFLRTMNMRKYNYSCGAHVIGYMGEIDKEKEVKDKYYTKGDLVGLTGIEAAYEKYLRGKKGLSIKLVDVHNQVQGKFNNGNYDSTAISGKNIVSTLDIKLQQYGEDLMRNKIGSIVAIEPTTGEILSLISSPTYSLDDLLGRKRSSSFKKLIQDKKKPLFNRALLGEYPPGSTFKLLNSLVILASGKIKSDMLYECSGSYDYGGRKPVGCHPHKSPISLEEGIAISCNSLFCQIFQDYFESFNESSAAYVSWKKNVKGFGIGDWMNNDFVSGRKGFLPNVSYFDKRYGKKRWNSGTIISMAIGQGELLLTPIQMANMTSIIANKGYYITPHIIKSIDNGVEIDSSFLEKKYSPIPSDYFEQIINGMEMSVKNKNGTAFNIYNDSISICGKTGTAENSKGEDHSIFIAFAPKVNPKIAIAVYVENQGWGSTWAAPIGALMIEYYLNKKVGSLNLENHIVNKVTE